MQNDRENSSYSSGNTMRVDPGDRLSHAPSRGISTGHIIAAVVILAAIIGVVMFTGDGEEVAPAVPELPVVQEQAPAAEPELPPAADIPEPEPVAPQVEEEAPPPVVEVPEEEPLTLDDSDEVVREELAAVGESALLDQVLGNSDLLRRGTGFIDGLSQGIIVSKALPLSPPTGKFNTLQVDGRTVMDPASYTRYDAYADAIADLDTARLAALFHDFRPLLEQAYEGLGNDPEAFDNALIRSLDRILATPEIDEPIPVKRKEAVFIYEDPSLEQLSPMQKQLLRMGPDNLRRVKQQARALRQALLAG